MSLTEKTADKTTPPTHPATPETAKPGEETAKPDAAAEIAAMVIDLSERKRAAGEQLEAHGKQQRRQRSFQVVKRGVGGR